MFDDFLLRALLAGIGVALIAGPLGSFVVWRRMAFFGVALAHASLLGVALGILWGIDPGFGVGLVCLVGAAARVLLERRFRLSGDTLLFVIAHGALAVGLVAVGLMEGGRVDLLAYLFGDILAVSMREIIWIYGGALLVGCALLILWRPLLKICLHEDLAQAEGVPVGRINLIFMLMIALVVAAAIKVVGILLVTSLLVIPAAAASRFARTPEQMAGLAALIGCASIGGGLFTSLRLDTPAGPSIVVAALVVFVLAAAYPRPSV